MEINSIGVCGAGTMGSGIAQAAAQAGFHSILFDLNEAVLEKARMNPLPSSTGFNSPMTCRYAWPICSLKPLWKNPN
jgi:predicted dinucleotide-binding enzyme